MLTTRQKIAKIVKFIGNGVELTAKGNIYGWDKELVRDNMTFSYNVQTEELLYKGWNNNADHKGISPNLFIIEFPIVTHQEIALEAILADLIQTAINISKDFVLEKMARELLAENDLEFIAAREF